VYYFIDEKTSKFVIAIVYVDDVCFMDLKYFPLLLKLKQKFIMKWECCNLRETKKFLEMYISHNYKDQRIFIDQSEYLNKILVHFNIETNLTSTSLPLGYMFKPNNKQYNPNFHQKYQQMVGFLMYLMIGSCFDIGFAIVKLAQQMANLSNEHY